LKGPRLAPFGVARSKGDHFSVAGRQAADELDPGALASRIPRDERGETP
jgi:hypothetical protein